ncbi:hypothetical protein TNCV_2649371 [Trichonephila clavipes]|nr:hypothetical protein TNCV_2649371 [Trichonephila clavipes]
MLSVLSKYSEKMHIPHPYPYLKFIYFQWGCGLVFYHSRPSRFLGNCYLLLVRHQIGGILIAASNFDAQFPPQERHLSSDDAKPNFGIKFCREHPSQTGTQGIFCMSHNHTTWTLSVYCIMGQTRNLGRERPETN